MSSIRVKTGFGDRNDKEKSPYILLVKNKQKATNTTGAQERPMMINPSIKSSYLDSRFENDIKCLVNRVNRMESLMERLLETNLSNNELMGEICKDLKEIVNKQTEKQLHKNIKEENAETSEDKNEDAEMIFSDEILIPRSKPSEMLKRKLDSASKLQQSIKKMCVVESIPSSKPELITEADSLRSTINRIQEKIESEINITTEERNVDEQHDDSQMEEMYLMPEEDDIILQPQKPNYTEKIYPLPLKHISELKEFDRDLKNDAQLRAHMVTIFASKTGESQTLESLLYSIIQESLVDKYNTMHGNEARRPISKTYLCEKFLYLNFMNHMPYGQYQKELAALLRPSSLKSSSTDLVGYNLPLTIEDDVIELEEKLKDVTIAEEFYKRAYKIYYSSKTGKAISLADLLVGIIDIDIIMQYNWDGKHYKKQLSQFKNIFEWGFKKVLKMETKEFDQKIKKAIRVVQNREHIHNSRAKKKLAEQGYAYICTASKK